MVNIHFLPCAWCAFIFFFCAFIPPDLLENPHAIFVSPLFLSVFNKRSGHFLLLQSKSSPSSAPHYFLIPSPLLLSRPLSPPGRLLSFLSIPRPTPLSPFQTHFFISTPTLSTHRCNGADFEEIKKSEKKKKEKKKRENVGMHMHSLSLSLDLTPVFKPHLALSSPLILENTNFLLPLATSSCFNMPLAVTLC